VAAEWSTSRAGINAMCTRILFGLVSIYTMLHAAVTFDQVRAILNASCARCHSGEQARAGLRLDSGAGIARVVVQGKSAESPLILRVTAEGARRMPLGLAPLKPEEIAILREWIDAGAVLGKEAIRTHWAYQKPVKPLPPQVRDQALVQNPIDQFLLARLEKEGLTFLPEASRETLIRRVSLDLTGLPPSPRETDEFLADNRPDAWERLVDRLLASPHYGERWARPWLDLARYADSNGFREDRPRSIWKYRDWVIGALNVDMPFDQFTIEQIAGDMLPDASTPQKIATGFHRNTQLNEEAGVDKDEAYFDVLVDRVNTTATVWLATTLGCAQCHDHKYDPFTQKDYYRMMAFFNNTQKRVEYYANGASAKYVEPELELPAPDQARKRDEIQARIAGLEARINADTPELRNQEASWERSILAASGDWRIIVPTQLSATAGATFKADGAGAVLVSGENAPREKYIVEGELALASLTGIRIEALPDPSLPRGGPGRDVYGNFTISSVEVELARSGSQTEWKTIEFRRPSTDDGRRKKGAWIVDATSEGKRLPRQLVLAANSQIQLDGRTCIRITIVQNSDSVGQNLGCFRISATAADNPLLVVKVSSKLRPALETDPAHRSPEQVTELSALFHDVASSLAPVHAEIDKLREEIKSLGIPTSLVMAEQPGGGRPYDFVRTRGAFLNKGEKVYADAPAALPPLPTGSAYNRLSLARWLASKDNPLTGRVVVNRIWEQYFGHGIVETTEDFGAQGERPVHPELLDWLATEFMDRGWSMKAIHRLIVTSRAYCQSSQVTPRLLEIDPYNRLIARGPRFRMEAEMIRDSALAASGLLSPKIGGPGVFPPQPAGVWDELPDNEMKWIVSSGEDRYRRAIYTFVRRFAPWPALMNFDAPSREICTARRLRTRTPLQALTTLNDEAFFEAARALSNRILLEGGSSDRSRVEYAFRLVTGRRPDAGETRRILTWQAQLHDRFAMHPDEARKIYGATAADAETRAAWTMTVNVLLNLDEALTKE
jgi:Protein of unknown function (DUF1553)/Protein of unknown function (DUF1549)/Planctomycete cytochrome C